MNSPFAVRPVREDDYDAFLELAMLTGGELTNIPADPDVVRWRVEESARSFELRQDRPGSHRYLFFLENVVTGEIAGICGIISKVGGFHPFYTYEIRRDKFSYPPLDIDHEVEVLYPNINYNGPSEVCCLFLRPEFRRGGLGRLLSLSRFHFMAAFPKRFDTEAIAELRGVTEGGTPPFWEDVAKHFFRMDFRRADYLSGLDDKDFIDKLLPKHPLYVPLLPPDARAVIGRPHEESAPALAMLLAEGFEHRGQIDIFDAGPVVEAKVESIRTVRDCYVKPVARIEKETSAAAASGSLLLSNARLDFRACVGGITDFGEDGVAIREETAKILQVKEGENIAFSALRPALGASPATGAESGKAGKE